MLKSKRVSAFVAICLLLFSCSTYSFSKKTTVKKTRIRKVKKQAENKEERVLRAKKADAVQAYSNEQWIEKNIISSCAEKPIIVVIPSYNNEQWVEKNVTSVLKQTYTNFKVVYVDDCSTDNTYSKVLQLVEKYQRQECIAVIHNKERRGALANLYTVIHQCDDKSIIVTVDGDDWLPHDGVLTYINEVYSKNDIWMTYGQFVEYPSNAICYEYSKTFSEDVIVTNSFRKVEQLPISHLRTFYAWLFKSIMLKDMLYEGNFYSMAWDKVMMAPMIEMAAHHHYCMPEVLYVYNNSNPINDHKVNESLQHSLAWYVLGLPAYKPLTCPQDVDVLQENDKANVVLLCQNMPKIETIESIVEKISSSQALFVFYPSDADIPLIPEQSKDVSFITYTEHDLVCKLQECLNNTDNRFVLVCSEAVTGSYAFDLAVPILAMKNSQADLFYCSIGRNSHQSYFSKSLPLVEKQHAIYAWYAQDKNDSWRIPVIDMTLWARPALMEIITQSSAGTIEDLFTQVEAHVKEHNKLGLMFAEGFYVRSVTNER